MRLDAVLVPLNIRLTPAELAWQLADCGAAAADSRRADAPRLAPRAAADLRRALPSAAPAPVARRCRRIAGRGARAPREVDARRAPSSHLHLGHDRAGPRARCSRTATTGGAPWARRSISATRRTIAGWPALPLFHVGGLVILLRSVIYGVPVIVHESFDPAAVNHAIDSEGVTMISVVSAMLRRMLDERAGRPYPPELRSRAARRRPGAAPAARGRCAARACRWCRPMA